MCFGQCNAGFMRLDINGLNRIEQLAQIHDHRRNDVPLQPEFPRKASANTFRTCTLTPPPSISA